MMMMNQACPRLKSKNVIVVKFCMISGRSISLINTELVLWL